MYGKAMAHIEKIVQTYPIEGADNLEMAQVLDYHVAVQKNQFKVGDLAIYVEIDSIVPDGLPEEHQPKMEELMKSFHVASGEEKDKIKAEMLELTKHNIIPAFEKLRSRGFKVKQVYFGKLKIYSQGILFNINDFPHVSFQEKIGCDLTDILGIKQVIEDPDEAGVGTEQNAIGKFLETNMIGKLIDKKMMRFKVYREFKKSLRQPKGIWHPYFPSQSDENNIQKVFTNMKKLHGDKKWYATEKLEGQNISIMSRIHRIMNLFNKHDVGVCTHHRFLPRYDGSGFWKTVKKLGCDTKLKAVAGNWFIRGEHVGPNIQENIYSLKETNIYLFDVYELLPRNEKRMLKIDEMINFCSQHGFKHVPIVYRGFMLPETVQELLDMSNGMSFLGTNVHREGLIFRLEDDPTVSFKVRSPVYLDMKEKKKEKKKTKKV